MKEVLKRLQEHLVSMSREELDAEYESITHEKFYDRWVEKVHNLTPEKRINLIQKVINKYESAEYIRREYRMGFGPRTELYFLLYEYAKKYGEIHEDPMYEDMFPSERLIIDGYIIRIMYGQGTVVDVFTPKEWEEHKERMKKY